MKQLVKKYKELAEEAGVNVYYESKNDHFIFNKFANKKRYSNVQKYTIERPFYTKGLSFLFFLCTGTFFFLQNSLLLEVRFFVGKLVTYGLYN
jgi:hypothetical protein